MPTKKTAEQSEHLWQIAVKRFEEQRHQHPDYEGTPLIRRLLIENKITIDQAAALLLSEANFRQKIYDLENKLAIASQQIVEQS